MKFIYLISILMLVISPLATAEDLSSSKNYVGRYVYSTGSPHSPEHTDPLNRQYKVSFVPTATYLQAIDRLLQQAGYAYVKPVSKKIDSLLSEWINRQLAPSHRELGLMEIRRSIAILHGQGWELKVDEIKKTASLSVKK